MTEPSPHFRDLSPEAEPGLLVELFAFLKHNRKWWLLPIVVVLLLVGGLIFLSGTAVAPFIYTLF